MVFSLCRSEYNKPDFYHQLTGIARKASDQRPVECAFTWGPDGEFYILNSYLTVVSEGYSFVAGAGKSLKLRCRDDDRLIDSYGNNLTRIHSVEWFWSKNKPTSLDSDEYELVFPEYAMLIRGLDMKPEVLRRELRWPVAGVHVEPQNPLLLTISSVGYSDAGFFKCEASARLVGRTVYGIRRVTPWEEPDQC